MKWYVCWWITGESGMEECSTKEQAHEFMDRWSGTFPDVEFKVILGEEQDLIDATRQCDLPHKLLRIKA
jgi:hypothetical protein